MNESGIRIYNDRGVVEMDSTKRTPLFIGETGLYKITSGSMNIPLPDFLSGDPDGVIAIARVVNSNSATNAVIKSITTSGIHILLKASAYRVTTSGAVVMPVNGSFIISFFRG